MTSLNEQLDRVATLLRRTTREEVEVVDGSVYVNFDFSQAVVVEPQLTERGQRYFATAMAWDRTHGVSDEYEIGIFTFAGLPAGVKRFLDQQDEDARKLEEFLASMPEDI